MQAIERIVIDTNWITITLVMLIICVFFLKRMDAAKLKGNVTSLTNNNFIETEIEDNNSIFSFYQSLLFVFSMTIISLTLYKIVLFKTVSIEQGYNTFFRVFGGVFSYFVLKWLLEFLLSMLFMVHKDVKFFLFSKSSYLYSISFLLLVGVILTEYSQLNTLFLFYFSIALFSIRFITHVVSNKKLIFSELFYFILYLCAFEIAPLFILFKILF